MRPAMRAIPPTPPTTPPTIPPTGVPDEDDAAVGLEEVEKIGATPPLTVVDGLDDAEPLIADADETRVVAAALAVSDSVTTTWEKVRPSFSPL